ncbi:hypothetical protein Q8A73_009720 [Channa argus]|nr:hypothetical protein Q8A73_009720 [Channa argus]
MLSTVLWWDRLKTAQPVARSAPHDFSDFVICSRPGSAEILPGPRTQHYSNPVWREGGEGRWICTDKRAPSVRAYSRAGLILKRSPSTSFFPSPLFVVNRSKAGVGGSLCARGAAAVPVERHRASASALDRRTS